MLLPLLSEFLARGFIPPKTTTRLPWPTAVQAWSAKGILVQLWGIKGDGRSGGPNFDA